MRMPHLICCHNQCYYIFYVYLINFSLIISLLCQQTTYLPAKMIPVDLLKFSSPTVASPNTLLTLAHSPPMLYCLCLQARIDVTVTSLQSPFFPSRLLHINSILRNDFLLGSFQQRTSLSLRFLTDCLQINSSTAVIKTDIAYLTTLSSKNTMLGKQPTLDT